MTEAKKIRDEADQLQNEAVDVKFQVEVKLVDERQSATTKILRHHLVRLREVLQKMNPDDPNILNGVPTHNEIDVLKLDRAWFNTDNCNAAQKLQRLAEETWNCLGQHSWNHL